MHVQIKQLIRGVLVTQTSPTPADAQICSQTVTIMLHTYSHKINIIGFVTFGYLFHLVMLVQKWSPSGKVNYICENNYCIFYIAVL